MPETAPYGNAGCAVHRRRRSRAATIGDRWDAGRRSGRPAARPLRRGPTGSPPDSAWLPPIHRRSVDDPSSGCGRSVVGLEPIRRRAVAELPSVRRSGCRRIAVGPSFGPSPVRRRGVRPLGTDLRAARRTGRRYRVRTRPAPPVRNPPHSRRVRTPPDRHPDTPNGTAHPLRTGRGGRMEAAAPLGRAPVERMISAHATVCFQPTSFPSQSLAEMADQPPCQQAEGDRAVRFHPTGTGHERQAHFPARLTSETLRDRMLPARLPCRHKAGW